MKILLQGLLFAVHVYVFSKAYLRVLLLQLSISVIIVFASENEVRNVMLQARELGKTNGDYAFIHVGIDFHYLDALGIRRGFWEKRKFRSFTCGYASGHQEWILGTLKSLAFHYFDAGEI